jgi:hypothetical protein
VAIVAQLMPDRSSDFPVTDATIAAAKAQQAKDRADAVAASGGALRLRDDGRIELAEPIPPRVLPLDQTVRLQEQIDQLVKEFGYRAVRRALLVNAAANGIGGAL